MNSVAWPPGYGKGLSSGELRLVNWTRTAHWSFSRAALNVQGVTDVHWSFKVRFATSMAARSLSIPSACATDIAPSNTKTAGNWRLVSMKPNAAAQGPHQRGEAERSCTLASGPLERLVRR